MKKKGTGGRKFSVTPGVDKARLMALWLEDKQGQDVEAIDVRGLTSVSDAVLVVTARGARHAKGLADHLLDRSGEHRYEYFGMEGYQAADWILMDMNDVVVHILQEEPRGFYNIEGMWADAPRLDWEGLVEPKPEGVRSEKSVKKAVARAVRRAMLTEGADDEPPAAKKPARKKPPAKKAPAKTAKTPARKPEKKAGTKPASSKAGAKPSSKPAKPAKPASKSSKPVSKPGAGKKGPTRSGKPADSAKAGRSVKKSPASKAKSKPKAKS